MAFRLMSSDCQLLVYTFLCKETCKGYCISFRSLCSTWNRYYAFIFDQGHVCGNGQGILFAVGTKRAHVETEKDSLVIEAFVLGSIVVPLVGTMSQGFGLAASSLLLV